MKKLLIILLLLLPATAFSSPCFDIDLPVRVNVGNLTSHSNVFIGWDNITYTQYSTDQPILLEIPKEVAGKDIYCVYFKKWDASTEDNMSVKVHSACFCAEEKLPTLEFEDENGNILILQFKLMDKGEAND